LREVALKRFAPLFGRLHALFARLLFCLYRRTLRIALLACRGQHLGQIFNLLGLQCRFVGFLRIQLIELLGEAAVHPIDHVLVWVFDTHLLQCIDLLIVA